MNSVRLIGRLANGLWQQSAVIAHALRHGYEYAIPVNTENNNIWKPYHFPEVNYCEKHPQGLKIYEERTHKYYPIPNSDNLLLSGYFQSVKYFEDQIDAIRDIFEFGGEMIDSVSIHVRRGDYTQMPKQFPVLPMAYYKIAMCKFPNEKFRVYSDDIVWCKENFIGDQFEFDESDELTAIKEMSRCRHNIIANSSFSLFASIMNNNPDKIVVAPKKFFGEMAKIDESTLVPENYIRI